MTVRRRQWTDSTGKLAEAWVVHVKFRHADGSVKEVRRTSPVNTRRGAEELERQIRQTLLAGTFELAAVPLFSDFANEFQIKYVEANNKPSERYMKALMLRTHLSPAFGALRLDQIGSKELAAYVADKLREGLSLKSIKNHQAILSKMFHTALEWQYIDRLPGIKLTKPPKPRFDFLTFDEAAALLSSAPDPMTKAVLMFALRAGARRGELLALQWQDLNLPARRVLIQRSVWKGIETVPKSGHAREVPLTTGTVQALEAVKSRGVYVFTHSDGEPWGVKMLTHRLQEAAELAKLRPITPHVLRHTFASHLVMRGVSLKAVQELMGHATIDMTMRYSHLAPEVKQTAVDLLDR